MLPEPAIWDEVELERARVEARLDELVPFRSARDQLNLAIRHSLLAPGKRLRPLMTILATEALGGASRSAVDPGCAVEMVHTASLIVDDLPCMDDAAERRGQASNHGRFGIATALLASVSLLNRAPAVIASAVALEPSVRLRLIRSLSDAVGDVSGLAAGQCKDLAAHPSVTALEALDRIVAEKTASLFSWCTQTAGLVSGADEATLALLARYGRCFGVCFQILDDLDDAHTERGDSTRAATDDGRKATFATLLGAPRAQEEAARHAEAAFTALGSLGLSTSALARLSEAALGEAFA